MIESIRELNSDTNFKDLKYKVLVPLEKNSDGEMRYITYKALEGHYNNDFYNYFDGELEKLFDIRKLFRGFENKIPKENETTIKLKECFNVMAEQLNKNKEKQSIDKKIPWYQEWYFISFIISLVLGLLAGLNFNLSESGVITAIIIFPILIMFNPKRRFFRVAIGSMLSALINFIPFYGALVIPVNSFLYGYLTVNQGIPYAGISFIILSMFLFWLDSKEK